MKTLRYLLVFACLLCIIAPPVRAHHSFAADYDASKPVTPRGTVTRFEWVNLHAHLYLDVNRDSGEITNWEFELGSPNALMRAGWTKNSLKIGDEVIVNFANQGNATSILSRDRKIVLSGVSAGEILAAR